LTTPLWECDACGGVNDDDDDDGDDDDGGGNGYDGG
jgi:hypothetical protein